MTDHLISDISDDSKFILRAVNGNTIFYWKRMRGTGETSWTFDITKATTYKSPIKFIKLRDIWNASPRLGYSYEYLEASEIISQAKKWKLL